MCNDIYGLKNVWKKTTSDEVVFEGSRELCEGLDHIVVSVFIFFWFELFCLFQCTI